MVSLSVGDSVGGRDLRVMALPSHWGRGPAKVDQDSPQMSAPALTATATARGRKGTDPEPEDIDVFTVFTSRCYCPYVYK